MQQEFDYVIFGAGIFGLYAGKYLAEQGKSVAVVEFDEAPIQRASFINQARVHNGYHYPRSVSTAGKSASYYLRFCRDFEFAVNKSFRKIYAIAANDSLTNAEQFLKFCGCVDIPAEEINASKYFQKGTVEAAFETLEYSYDAKMIRDWFVEKMLSLPNVSIFYKMDLKKASIKSDRYVMDFHNHITLSSDNVLNATYASINQILNKFDAELLKIKYEICEVILTKVNTTLEDVGITIMDGPFFSVMPFGKSGYHSLTSVGDTPHMTSTDPLPAFSCQSYTHHCSPLQLNNCSHCSARPVTAWNRMSQLAKKFLVPDIEMKYDHSLFAVKTILAAAELDDARPTIIKQMSTSPNFYTVLSGKFNTIYDLEDILV